MVQKTYNLQLSVKAPNDFTEDDVKKLLESIRGFGLSIKVWQIEEVTQDNEVEI